MDEGRPKELIDAERERVHRILSDTVVASREERDTADETGDMEDPAEPLTAKEVDDAVAEGLRQRLEALDRAEARLRAGTYGRSVRSGAQIPDERLEADPAAELTVEEAAEEPER